MGFLLRINDELLELLAMDGNELSFVAGNYNTPDGIGSVGVRIDDVVEAIRLEDDGSYTIEFNQYMADINIKESNM